MGFFWKVNQEAEERVKDAINLATKAITKYFDGQLVSIILIGSFPRGEGIWKTKENKIHILSDLDLLVIVKTRAKIPLGLSQEILQAVKETNIDIDLKIKSSFKLRFYPKDTHAYDYLHAAKVIYGKNSLSLFPRVSNSDIGIYGIESIFFNRAILNIEKISPQNLTSSADGDLLNLSYLAAKTMFTCADIISIYHQSYSSFIRDRVRVAEEKAETFEIHREQFIKDLNIAFEFIFEQPNKLCIEDVCNYWARTQRHLVRLFLFTMGRKDDFDEISHYPFHSHDTRLHYLERVRLFFKKLEASYILFKKYRHLNLFWRIHPMVCCRMACLMLYMAIGKEKDDLYIKKAANYFSNIYPLKSRERDVKSQWLLLRNNLLELKELGVF